MVSSILLSNPYTVSGETQLKLTQCPSKESECKLTIREMESTLRV